MRVCECANVGAFERVNGTGVSVCMCMHCMRGWGERGGRGWSVHLTVYS